MRNFFLTLLVLSLMATGGVYAWRTYAPEGDNAPQSAAHPAPGGAASRGLEGSDTRRELREERRAARQERRRTSERQDWAMTASIASSIISAIAAIGQLLLTHRSLRRSS